MILDTHVHFWRYTPAEFGWLTGGLAPLRRDYLPADFAFPDGGLVAVQARQSIEETDWLLSLAKDHPQIRGVVGWLPLASGAVESLLAGRPLAGVRHVLQAEPPAFFEDAAFNRGLQVLARHDVAYDLLVTESQLKPAIELADRHPALRWVVDHLAKPDLSAGPTDTWRRGMRELARRDNVCCKMSGGITEAKLDWQPDELMPYFDAVLEAFGPGRLLYGSNWPVSEAAGGMDKWLGAVGRWAAKLSRDEQLQLFGRSAARVYRLEKP